VFPPRRFQRIVIVVLDSVGVGELPDADSYGDAGSNTLSHTAQAVGGLDLPHLQDLGLGCIASIEGVPPPPAPAACYGKMAERSLGKDTTIGHWEIAGVITTAPFPTYPDGFPPDVIAAFEAATGRAVLGNRPASGTRIIEELGEEHLATGKLIVYTSADSVFQIAAHEDTVPVEELYDACAAARRILIGEHGVARVIARPFVGRLGHFVRTARRKDFSLPPPGPTLLDLVSTSGLSVTAIGKIDDLFAGRGITRAMPTRDNAEGLRALAAAVTEGGAGLVFGNLIDFDMLYGHRNDPAGYARALKQFDDGLGRLLPLLREDDVLMLTADHGCDPTTPSTDHSREYVPLLVTGRRLRGGVDLGTRASFADVSATTAAALGLQYGLAGESFLGAVAAG
jgi:phosphopentomutase